MIDPNATLTVGQAFSMLKDAAFFIGIPLVGWKARGLFQPLLDFFKDAKLFMTEIREHMSTMDSNMEILLNNHLIHIESDLKQLSGRKGDVTDTDDSVGSN